MSDTMPAPRIIGYRKLSDKELALVNEAKVLANICGEFIAKLEAEHETEQGTLCDLDWLYTGTMDLKKGWMAVVRSITKPTTF